MSSALPATALQLRSTIRSDATLVLSLEEVPLPEPEADQVLVRIEAAPINPSDLGLLFGPADVATARAGGSRERPTLVAEVPQRLMKTVAARVDQALPVGNEGAGVVVKTGSSPAARGLLGRTVALFGGAMYAQYRCVPAALCLPLPEGTTAVDGASCFVNPLTALGMLATMRREGHAALVHTAAASNLGQMLVKLCRADGVALVNVVRRSAQVDLLEQLGATHVCSSGEPDFRDRLVHALVETGATLAFDATGGGELADRILACMELAASRQTKEYSRYGSSVHKQVYLYGGLDRSPTVLHRTYGMAWGVGGWLLPHFLQRIGAEAAQELRDRVAREIKTTFSSHYSKQLSLAGALRPDAIAAYGRQATGEKYLIRPNLDPGD